MDVNDYIGKDPVKWLDRLIEVNERSQFHPTARAYINSRLRELQDKVSKLAPDPSQQEMNP